MADAGGWVWDDDDDDEVTYGQEPDVDPDKVVAVRGVDGTVLLLDATEVAMDKGEGVERSLLRKTIGLVVKSLMDAMITRPSDLVSVVFFGAKTTRNENEFPGVNVLQELEVPSVALIRQLENFWDSREALDSEVGVGGDPCLGNALWTCSKLFAKQKKTMSSKRVLLFTATDAPCGVNDPERRRILAKVEDAAANGISVEVVPVVRTPADPFDFTKIYGDFDKSIGQEPKPFVLDGSDAEIQALSKFRSRVLRQRPAMVLPFTLVRDGATVGVRIYDLHKVATRGSKVSLRRSDNSRVDSKTSYFCNDTGQQVRYDSIKKKVDYGGDKVVFSKQEVAKMKAISAPGMTLLGFKDNGRLKLHDHVKEGRFVYPDDATITGSTKALRALRDSCVRLKKVAICRLVGSRLAEPRLVALYPNSPDDGAPDGFHLAYLPYREEIRKPQLFTREAEIYDDASLDPSDRQLMLMREVVNKLTDRKFNHRRVSNPALQRHYRALEALAFNRDDIEDRDRDDTLVVDNAVNEAAGSSIELCAEALGFPPDYDADSALKASSKPKSKRKADGKSSSAAKKSRATAADVPSLGEMHQRFLEGTVAKLTVAALKAFCAENQVDKSGSKKGDLVAAVQLYFAKLDTDASNAQI